MVRPPVLQHRLNQLYLVDLECHMESREGAVASNTLHAGRDAHTKDIAFWCAQFLLWRYMFKLRMYVRIYVGKHGQISATILNY